MKYKILHQHLIKCGGTTINTFLNSKYDANRINYPMIPRFWFDACRDHYVDEYGSPLYAHYAIAELRFRLYDCVHGHNPLLYKAPLDFFSFTILRDPVQRVISQIRDWKRLEEGDYNNRLKVNNDFLRFVKTASFKEILDNWNQAPIGMNNLSNMQTRLLSLSFTGPGEKWDIYNAISCLKSLDIVGVVENLSDFLLKLCYNMRWCPPKQMFYLNKGNDQDEDIDTEAIETIKELNKSDEELYALVRNEHDDASDYRFYDLDYFEDSFAHLRTGFIPPVLKDQKTFLFDFNMPLIGNGFWMRDAENSSECSVWTGPETKSSLFMPVLALADLEIILVIKGYVDNLIRNELRIIVDGNEKDFYFEDSKDYKEILLIPYKTYRSFIRLDIQTPFIMSTSEDQRNRGVSIIFYGYRL